MKSKMQKILLIEDNPDDVFLFKFALKKAAINANVQITKNGEDALNYISRLIRNKEEYPDFIFLDINMPKICGVDVLERIKSSKVTWFTSVLVLTSADDLDLLKDKDTVSYIKKPNNINDFSSILKRVISLEKQRI